MVAKIVKGKGFKGVVNYVLDKAKQTELLAAEGVRYKSRESIIRSLVAQASLNPKVSKSVGHISLDFSAQSIRIFILFSIGLTMTAKRLRTKTTVTAVRRFAKN
jgi:hypothetical protein